MVQNPDFWEFSGIFNDFLNYPFLYLKLCSKIMEKVIRWFWFNFSDVVISYPSYPENCKAVNSFFSWCKRFMMICLTDWCVVYWHIWQEDYVVFFYLPHSLSFDLQNCFVNKQIIDLILFLFLSFIKVDNFFVYKVILQNVPEKNGKNDSGVFICINMWGNFGGKKMAKWIWECLFAYSNMWVYFRFCWP